MYPPSHLRTTSVHTTDLHQDRTVLMGHLTNKYEDNGRKGGAVGIHINAIQLLILKAVCPQQIHDDCNI